MSRALLLLCAAFVLAAGEAGSDWRMQVAAGHVVQPQDPPREWRFAALPLPPVAEIAAQTPDVVPPYGCYSWGGEYRQFRQDIRRVGFTTYRLGGFIDEPAIVQAMEDGIEIMHTLQIGTTLDELRKAGKRDAFPSDEAFIAAYVGVLERFCARYAPGGSLFVERPELAARAVRHLEIWNEPNFQYMLGDQPDMAAVRAARDRLYARLLRAAHAAVKATHPEVRIVAFAAGGAAFDDKRFITNVHELDPRIAECYDILSTHPYTHTPPLAERMKSWGAYSVAGGWRVIRDVMAAHGAADRPLWYTEVGWPMIAADGGQFAQVRKTDIQHTAMLQAACVVKMYALALRLGVRRVYVMSAADADGFNSGFFDRRTGEWRPSAHAVRNMIALLPRPRLLAAPGEAPGGPYAFHFASDWTTPGSPEVIMAWREGGPVELAVPLPPGRQVAVVRDMIGGEVPFQDADGAARCAGGPLPVYIVLR